jgi:hypothetical protein
MSASGNRICCARKNIINVAADILVQAFLKRLMTLHLAIRYKD